MSFRGSLDIYARGERPHNAANPSRKLRSYSTADQRYRPHAMDRMQQIPLSAHPAQIVAAYYDLVQDEIKRRGINNSVDQLKAMREEILAMRRETAALEGENRIMRARIVKTQENYRKAVRAIAQLRAYPLSMHVFEQKTVNYNGLGEQQGEAVQKANALRAKIQEVYQANVTLQKSIQAAKDACKAYRLGRIKESFKAYYDRFYALRDENMNLEQQIYSIEQETARISK